MWLEESRDKARPWVLGAVAAGLGWVVGCASPAGPRPPSLHLPEPVRDLTATRTGDQVELRFTVPSRTTDGVGLREASINGVLCRQDAPSGACHPVDAEETRAPLTVPVGGRTGTSPVIWHDVLPPALESGPARAISYRVELRNGAGKSAGYSDAVYVAAGSAPSTVQGFAAQAMRPGVLLQWQPASDSSGKLIVRREALEGSGAGKNAGPRKAKTPDVPKAGGRKQDRSNREGEAVVYLTAEPSGSTTSSGMVDGTVEEGVPYRYSAVRVVTAHVGGRVLELRSKPSASVEVTWHDVYPPAAPTGLTALGYTAPGANGAEGEYAVDLVWQPVSDPRVSGYVVTRQRVDAAGAPVGSPDPLTGEPVQAPGFHDATAHAGESYRYTVTAVDAKGNVSAPATAIVVATAG